MTADVESSAVLAWLLGEPRANDVRESPSFVARMRLHLSSALVAQYSTSAGRLISSDVRVRRFAAG
jgi:hypothetical protein